MEDNDFITDNHKDIKKKFPLKLKILLGCGIFFTAPSLAIFGVLLMPFQEDFGKRYSSYGFAVLLLAELGYFICFISLITIAAKKQYFTKMLTRCVKSIGALFMAASLVLPRLSGYHGSNFEIITNGKGFTLMDGLPLVVGIVILIFSYLLQYGFEMQKEMDEIL